MSIVPRLLIIADFDPQSRSHAATEQSIVHGTRLLGREIEVQWIGTQRIAEPGGMRLLKGAAGVWIGPGSPYLSMDGALAAIRWARENGIPMFGTCGGFQHILLEYTRNVLGMLEADHEESSPGASQLLISRLACSLVDRSMKITLKPGSMVHRIYGQSSVEEEYLCNFGVNPKFVDRLLSGPLQAVGSDAEGQVRAVELPSHPFLVGTLFLPQHRSTFEGSHPLVLAFLGACLRL